VCPASFGQQFVDNPPQLAQELPAKLDHQFEKYKSGHNYLIGQIFNSNTTMITKTEWEDLLSPVQ
jgi:hypothetical protein